MRKIYQQVAKLPLINILWRKMRLKNILQNHQSVADFWKPIIKDYSEDKIKKYNLLPKQNLPTNKIIWQYWGQGIHASNIPEIVHLCFVSVDQYKGDYQVIRLDDNSIIDYIDLPDFVLEKRNNPSFNRTFFSDLLRLALLKAYGGVWLDATILMTGPLPQKLIDLDYFMFQRSEDALYKAYWESTYAYYWSWNPNFKVRVLNSIFFGKKDGVMITILLDLMLYYWKTKSDIPDYFFFQILYNELVTGKMSNFQCLVLSDTIPHIIQTKVNGEFDDISYSDILRQSTLHKMAYYEKSALRKLKDILINYKIINNI
ncbi:capsular biosynthesis protein [Elizabethkingia anophelis]|nr:capsular biosynthesis protein [Elizabethkingia anophelis]